MTQTLTPSLTLEDFLERPETKPALEYINGTVVEKNMPQGEHSRLQYKLCSAISTVAETAKVACAFPELRCTFGGRSIVPDISVFRWERIPRTDTGKIANRFELYPDWVIEILSPNQSSSQALDKLLQCSQAGTSLGWLINPTEESIWVIREHQRIDVFTAHTTLPVLEGIELQLTVDEILGWLMI
ncbi:Uma2 family endonuclease [Roseofilum capinflatum]|uniref:Uma2 family endonuclease n=1 Tax=Roseofilum capinflatum BLCC-M114 TaxID=3022440 RepID=A0ABT7BD24_9CYAN|nr:Uma2 family endonuclease [Roseofilum capinflatum]MDJ1177093.1 Uma2 family endonuclease [Roseofilum capinflatum BLCC-M114]